MQSQIIKKVEPAFWWADMKYNQVQVMVYGTGISNYTPVVKDKLVRLVSVDKSENKNYLFLNLDFSQSTAMNFEIKFKKKGVLNDVTINYELKSRKKNSALREGFDSSDALYLITPDRFANGNVSNDIVAGLKEEKIDRKDNYARHGGDILGIIEHLDYIENMGFTAVWPSPLLTNNMHKQSYHGYAMTDFYEVDPRFGDMESYRLLSEKMEDKGLKLIMDQVLNHCGLEHWWMKDLPFKDWVNYQEYFEEGKELPYSNHKRTTNQDIYASEKDAELMTDGWFTQEMPDLNQKNPFLAKYLIQNSIWWIETMNLAGIRQDTYPYPDKNFMSDWAGAIMEEYPNFSIVGEEWSYNPLLVGYWQTGANNKDGYESNLTSTMDFPMQRKIIQGFNEEETWETGLVKIYEGLANDFHYATPKDIMIFADNHDMSRVFTQLNGNVKHTKMALGYILCMPRIPQIYYGTEILMNDFDKPGDHGLVRTDFPGGWSGDEKNAFTGEGLNSQEKEMQSFLKTLLNYRKDSQALHHGKTIHFAPEDGVYVLFRKSEDEILAIILNKNKESITLDLNRFSEIGLNGESVKNIHSKEEFIWDKELNLSSEGVYIITTKL
ncbi:glycoside hydrolase family 13 protein [Flavicella sp.]|uniref:glycoside hydrolase family 13 protein n=1 Tax=Flavicella sp. TaxID=2957742 RepID=UPI002606FC32|nr:glycoside hydrolase family 13 protein [Flavicella sp.]MDG1804502.1 glycoside hydrolase family 13 protein [Flavicella sp.]